MLSNELVHTTHYLSELAGGITLESIDSQDLITLLVTNLANDGYKLEAIGETYSGRHLQEEDPHSSDFIVNLVLIFCCVMFAGLASGLTQGLLSLDYMEMKIKSQSGTPKEKEYANRVIPIISNHHLLLVSLMLWNASATEALPIFLNKIVPEYVAIIISVTLVLLFGEIIPASILTGPKQLQIAANLVPLVYLVLFVFFPVAYPISQLLDYLIGHDEGMTMYNRKEIATLMWLQHEEGVRRQSLHKKSNARSDNPSVDMNFRDTMHHEEVTIIGGALKYRDMKVSEVMTHVQNIFMISAKDTLSFKTLYEIFKAGYSRIPVFDKDRDDIVGLILAKDLIFVDPEDETSVEGFLDLFGRKPMVVWHDSRLGETLSSFRQHHAHLAIVRDVVNVGSGDPYYAVVGIITLEDIIEEILGTEIEDETDSVDQHDEAASGGGLLTSTTATLRDMDLARLKSLRRKITDDKLSEDEIQAIVNCIEKQVPAFPEILRREYPTSSLPQVVKDSGVLKMKRKTPEGEKPHPDDFLIRRGKMTTSCILILQGRVRVFRKVNTASTNTTGESSGLRKRQYSMDTHHTRQQQQQQQQQTTTDTEESATTSPTKGLLDGQDTTETMSVMNESTDNLVALGAPSASSSSSSSYQEVIRGPWSLIGENALLQDEGTYIPDFSVIIDSDDIRFVRITMFTSKRLTQSIKGLSTIERKRRDALQKLYSFNLPLPALPPPSATASSNSLRRNHTVHDASDLYYDDLLSTADDRSAAAAVSAFPRKRNMIPIVSQHTTITEESSATAAGGGSMPSSSPSDSNSLRMQRLDTTTTTKNPMISAMKGSHAVPISERVVGDTTTTGTGTAVGAGSGDEEEGFNGGRSYSESEATQYLQDYYNHPNRKSFTASTTSVNRKSFIGVSPQTTTKKKF